MCEIRDKTIDMYRETNTWFLPGDTFVAIEIETIAKIISRQPFHIT